MGGGARYTRSNRWKRENGQEDLLKKTGTHGFAAGDELRRGMEKQPFADCCGLKEKRGKGCRTKKKEISKNPCIFRPQNDKFASGQNTTGIRPNKVICERVVGNKVVCVRLLCDRVACVYV